MVKLDLKLNSKLVLNHMKIKYYPTPPFTRMKIFCYWYSYILVLGQRLQWVRSGISTTMEGGRRVSDRTRSLAIHQLTTTVRSCLYLRRLVPIMHASTIMFHHHLCSFHLTIQPSRLPNVETRPISPKTSTCS